MTVKEQVRAYLRSLPGYEETKGGIESTVFCPYCTDRYGRHGHFGIKINDADPLEPLKYKCLKCNVSGYLTSQILLDLGLNPTREVLSDLKVLNHKAKLTKGSKINTAYEAHNVPIVDTTSTTLQKLGYLNSRLGTGFTVEDSQRFKIVLSLGEFFEFNGLDPKAVLGKEESRQKWFRLLDTHYIGFLSNNNNNIILRDTSGRFERYIKLTLNRNNTNPFTFYSIPTMLDILYTDNVKVHMAEGVFDILSIYRMYEGKPAIYAACCGYSYSSIISYLAYMGVVTDIDAYVYCDNDKPTKDLKRSIGKAMIWLDYAHVIRNTSGEKDFGVTPDKIRPSRPITLKSS